jgi:hypothetical protein
MHCSFLVVFLLVTLYLQMTSYIRQEMVKCCCSCCSEVQTKGQDFGMLCCVVRLCFFHCCHSYWSLKLFVHGSGNSHQWNARSAVLLVVVFSVLRVFESENRQEVGIIWWQSVFIFICSHVQLYSVIWIQCHWVSGSWCSKAMRCVRNIRMYSQNDLASRL